MERVYEEAFYEVDEVLKLMPIDLRSKIPIQFRQVISENKAKNYKKDIHEPLNKQELKKETIIILGLIYRDFICSAEERDKLQIQDAEEIRQIQEELNKQYDMNNVFENKKKKKEPYDSSKDLVLYEEPGFIKKIFNLIKGIFKKNKF